MKKSRSKESQRSAARKQLRFLLGKDLPSDNDPINVDRVIDTLRTGKNCRDFVLNLTSQRR